MRKLVATASVIIVSAFSVPAFAQNTDFNIDRWGNNNGFSVNTGNYKHQENRSDRGYNGNQTDYDNRIHTNFSGNRNDNSSATQFGDCTTGNCSYSSHTNSSEHRSTRSRSY